MQNQRPYPVVRLVLGCTALWLATGVSVLHADTRPGSDNLYQRDVNACKNGRTGQDLDTCMTEARRAQDARKKGALDTTTDALQANAHQRCTALAGEARAACLARMDGRGSVSGSVSGGGILREVETVVIQPGAGPVTIEPKTADPVVLVPKQP